MLNNMKISLRIALAFGLILVLTAGMSFIAIYNMGRVQKNLDRIVNVNYTRSELAHGIAYDVRAVIVQIRDMLLEKRPEKRQAIVKNVQEFRGKYAEKFKKIEGMVNKSDSEGVELLKKIEDNLAVVRPLNTKVMEMALANRNEAAIAMLNDEVGPAVNKLVADLDAFVAHQSKRKEFRYAESTAMYRDTRFILFVLATSVIAVGCFIALFLSRGIIKPLNNVAVVTKAMSTGNLNKDIEARGKDEVGQTLSDMKQMVTKLRKVVSDVKLATENVAADSNKLSATSDDINKGSQELSGQVEQIVTSMTEVSQTIMDMAKNASQAADASKNASETAAKGKKIVDTTAEDMAKIAQTVQEAAGTIEELGRSSAQIGEIVTVINSIADQTNLLALNAAIEAARAGEQGRGFAVVADEVRKLAERTSQATKDITQRIAAIQAAAGESVDAMKRGSDEVDKGVGLAKEASASLDTIVSASNNAMDMVQRIAAATEQQSAATEEVTQSMENISGISKQSSASTTQIKVSSGELAKLALGLKEMAAFFKS